MSRLHVLLDDYLVLRRGLGFKLREQQLLLSGFVDFVEQAGAESVTVELALGWAKRPTGVEPFRWKQRLSMVRGFARYVQAFDPATEVPPDGLLAYRYSRPTPFLFSEKEIAALLAAADTLRSNLLAVTYRTLFGLLAVTGLRVGEAITLSRKDVDLVHGLLIVRQTKFNKSRLLPLHPSTSAALTSYTRERNRLCPTPKPSSFFVSTAGTSLFYSSVRKVFLDLVHEAGVKPRSSCRPRLHGLRHSFVVNTLLAWYRADVDVAAKLPALAAYLGHSHPASTYWYLQAVPELLAVAAQRLGREHATGELP